MKKIDKLILTSFLGPFVLTFLVVVFILLLQHMLKYFDDIVGKDLGWGVVGTLLFYFGVFMTPLALPLAVLLSSLITFGNLSEHFEITAVKSLGISLTRSLIPLFIFSVMLAFVAFYANNNWVPKAALEAYSLMYDIKQKKPALDLQEGAFYSGIPDISIKVNKKFPDGMTLKDVIIYDHRGRTGNKQVTIADSGRMFTILNDQYLKLELYRGYDYTEGAVSQGLGEGNVASLRKTKFEKSEMVFDLSSFGLNRTDKRWFQGNRIMRNVVELNHDMDSVGLEMGSTRVQAFNTYQTMFAYHVRLDSFKMSPALAQLKAVKDSIDEIRAPGSSHYVYGKVFRPVDLDTLSAKTRHVSDSICNVALDIDHVDYALNKARLIKTQLQNLNTSWSNHYHEYKIFRTQWHKILANSVACIVMFLIGAPLGAIIKKGGLGVPVIVSILFFILFYLINSTGEKWGDQDKIPVPVGIWAADVILTLVGLIFLRQARVDARLFDSDYYRVALDKLKLRFRKQPTGV